MCHKRRNARRAFIEQQMMAQQSGMMGGNMGMGMGVPMYAPRRRGPICGLISMATKPLMMSSNQPQYAQQYAPQYHGAPQFQPQYQNQPQYQAAPMQQQSAYGAVPVYGQAPQYQTRDISPGQEQQFQAQRGFVEEEYKDEKEGPMEFVRERASVEGPPAYEPARNQQRMSLPERTKN